MKFKFLPNTTFFSAIPTGNNSLTEIFNLQSKNHEYFNIEHARINKANKYLKKTYRRLYRLASNMETERFMFLADKLLRRSVSFQAVAFHIKYDKWYSNFKASTIKAIWWDVEEFKTQYNTQVKFKRIFIPKGDDKFGRPLGVPIKAWRIYSWMMLQILEIWFTATGNKAPWQHEGYSKRGTTTFWEQIIKKGILNAKYIYEFDLKGFFNNVHHDAIITSMNACNVPEKITKWITEMVASKPTSRIYPKIKDERKEFIQMAKLRATFGHSDWMTGWGETGYHSRLDYLSEATVADERDVYFNLSEDYKGVPQGLGISPFLSVTTLCNNIGIDTQGIIMYMDDGLLFADDEGEMTRNLLSFERACKNIGVSLAPEKSGLVKEDGEWKKDLKIVGQEYLPEIDWMRSNSRKGVIKMYPKVDMSKVSISTLNASKTLMMTDYSTSLSFEKFKEEIQKTPTHETATKHGILGKIFADTWASSTEDPKRLIQQGQMARIEEIESNKNSFYFDKRGKIYAKSHTSMALEGPSVLMTISTEMIDELLTYVEKKGKKEAKRPGVTR